MDEIRLTGQWMQLLDDRILEKLAREGLSWPSQIARDPSVGGSEARVHERCRVLCEAGLIEPFLDEPDVEMFEISAWGMLYLEGEVDADLDRPTPGMRPPDKVRPGWWAGFG
jgi:hypothetical protein